AFACWAKAVSSGRNRRRRSCNPIGFCRVQLSRHLAGKDAVGSEGDDYADVIAPGFLQKPRSSPTAQWIQPAAPGPNAFPLPKESLTTGPRRRLMLLGDRPSHSATQ